MSTCTELDYCYQVPPEIADKPLPEIVSKLTGNRKLAPYSNCWNSTLLFHKVPVPRRWEDDETIQAWLRANTRRYEQHPRRYGDILWIGDEDEDYIKHTAVYVGNGWYWHKDGDRIAEFATLDRVLQRYGDADWHHRRLIKGSNVLDMFDPEELDEAA